MDGTDFTRITLPTGFGNVNVAIGSNSLGTFASGATVDFEALTGGAVGSFRLSGLTPLVDAAFPVQVFFTGAPGSLTQILGPPTAAGLLVWRPKRRC